MVSEKEGVNASSANMEVSNTMVPVIVRSRADLDAVEHVEHLLKYDPVFCRSICEDSRVEDFWDEKAIHQQGIGYLKLVLSILITKNVNDLQAFMKEWSTVNMEKLPALCTPEATVVTTFTKSEFKEYGEVFLARALKLMRISLFLTSAYQNGDLTIQTPYNLASVPAPYLGVAPYHSISLSDGQPIGNHETLPRIQPSLSIKSEHEVRHLPADIDVPSPPLSIITKIVEQNRSVINQNGLRPDQIHHFTKYGPQPREYLPARYGTIQAVSRPYIRAPNPLIENPHPAMQKSPSSIKKGETTAPGGKVWAKSTTWNPKNTKYNTNRISQFDRRVNSVDAMNAGLRPQATSFASDQWIQGFRSDRQQQEQHETPRHWYGTYHGPMNQNNSNPRRGSVFSAFSRESQHLPPQQSGSNEQGHQPSRPEDLEATEHFIGRARFDIKELWAVGFNGMDKEVIEDILGVPLTEIRHHANFMYLRFRNRDDAAYALRQSDRILSNGRCVVLKVSRKYLRSEAQPWNRPSRNSFETRKEKPGIHQGESQTGDRKDSWGSANMHDPHFQAGYQGLMDPSSFTRHPVYSSTEAKVSTATSAWEADTEAKETGLRPDMDNIEQTTTVTKGKEKPAKKKVPRKKGSNTSTAERLCSQRGKENAGSVAGAEEKSVELKDAADSNGGPEFSEPSTTVQSGATSPEKEVPSRKEKELILDMGLVQEPDFYHEKEDADGPTKVDETSLPKDERSLPEKGRVLKAPRMHKRMRSQTWIAPVKDETEETKAVGSGRSASMTPEVTPNPPMIVGNVRGGSNRIEDPEDILRAIDWGIIPEADNEDQPASPKTGTVQPVPAKEEAYKVSLDGSSTSDKTGWTPVSSKEPSPRLSAAVSLPRSASPSITVALPRSITPNIAVAIPLPRSPPIISLPSPPKTTTDVECDEKAQDTKIESQVKSEPELEPEPQPKPEQELPKPKTQIKKEPKKPGPSQTESLSPFAKRKPVKAPKKSNLRSVTAPAASPAPTALGVMETKTEPPPQLQVAGHEKDVTLTEAIKKDYVTHVDEKGEVTEQKPNGESTAPNGTDTTHNTGTIRRTDRTGAGKTAKKKKKKMGRSTGNDHMQGEQLEAGAGRKE